MQAIETRYFGPTNSRSARVKAQCEAGGVTVPWDDALGIEENHIAAARVLCTKLGWTGRRFAVGSMPGRHSGYAFCLVATEVKL